MDSEPIAVALKFGFLAVLYLFLFWAARSAIRDVRDYIVGPDRGTDETCMAWCHDEID